MLRRIVSNSGILMLEKIFSMASTLIITILLTRYFTVEEWGVLSYLIAIVGLVSPLAALGLNSLISKAILDSTAEQSSIMGTAIGLRFVGAISGFLILVLVSYFFFADEPSKFKYVIILSFGSIFLAFSGVSFYFEAYVISKFAALARLLGVIFTSLLKVYAIYNEWDFELFVWIFAADFIIQGLLLLIVYQCRTRDIQNWKFKPSIAKGLLSQSGWLILSSLCAVIYLKIDQVMLGQLATMEDVGQYALAAKLSEVWFFLPTAIAASVYPILLRIKTDDIGEYRKKLQLTCDILLMFAVIIAVSVQVFSPWLVKQLFDPSYSSVSHILQVHIWCGIFVFMRALASKWLIIENLLRFSLLTQGVGAVTNIIANLILIPKYGAIGAAYGTIISYAFASWIAFFISNKTRFIAMVMLNSFCIPIRVLKLKS